MKEVAVRNKSLVGMHRENGETGQDVKMVHVRITVDQNDSPVGWKLLGQKMGRSGT